MLPMMYSPFLTYHSMMYQKITCDKACQFPETQLEEPEQESQIAKELTALLGYLSKNISLLKETAFEEFSRAHLHVSLIKEQLLNQLFKEVNVKEVIKKRYLQVNKTKEEMTKFIIRRCFLFIKTQLNYLDSENLPAEERDKIFYTAFFGDDEGYLEILKESHQTIDDMIPFRKDSKMKTMNENYLRILFKSKKFVTYYQKFLSEFKEICVSENLEKIDNMTKQLIKILYSRDFAKIKSYRRFPWKDHELIKCEDRAKELYQKYHDQNKRIDQKVLTKNEIHLEKTDLSSEKSSETQQ